MPDAAAQEAIVISLISYIPLRSRSALAGFLDVLEATPNLIPTHWGQDVRARNPYDRAELIEQISAHKGMFFTPGLRRGRGIRYEAYFDSFADGLGRIKFDFGPTPAPSDLPRLFNLADALADYFQPTLGFIHRFWRAGEGSDQYNAAGRVNVDSLQKYGLDRVCTRTWYGPHLTHLVGLPLLEASGALVRETPWGGVQIDLVQRPWEAEPEALAAAQGRVMQTLITSQAYGDFADFFNQKPGVRWTPLPNTRPILPLSFPQPPCP